MTRPDDASVYPPDREVADAVARVFRGEWGRVLGHLARLLGDLSAAEDAVQDAFAVALRTWPSRGVPDNPAAWITTTARNRALDRLRRESDRDAKERAAAHERARYAGPPPAAPQPVPDDQLRLLFTCCHPALAGRAQVTLTLRLVCGLRTTEVARVLLEAEPTAAQRLSRAKRKIRDAGIPLRVPPAEQLPERLPHVLTCVYLVFTCGYSAADGDRLIRDDLCDEARRLALLLVELLPDEPEARGLLALVLLQDARRPERTRDGELVLLADQDRTRWDRRLIDLGLGHLRRALAAGPPGPYRLQASIAAAHAEAASFEDTDWSRIAALYAELARRAPSPVVELNRAVAVAHARGPAAGLAIVDAVSSHPGLARTHRLPATRAELLARLGRLEESAAAYRRALALAATGPERRHLAKRLAQVTSRVDTAARRVT